MTNAHPVRRRATARTRAWVGAGTLVVVVAVVFMTSAPCRAEVEAAARLTLFREPSSSNSGITVTHPQVDASAGLSRTASINAGYELDVVSGATPRTYAPKARAMTVDATTGATSFHDERQAVHGGLGFDTASASVNAAYSYGWERDYRSHTLQVGSHGDFLDHNFTLSLGYTRNFDSVCDNNNGQAQGLLDLQPLASSSQCFVKAQTETVVRKVDINTFEPSLLWTATPRLLLQTGAMLQLVDGFQSSPYRSVRIGNQGRAAQEHVPTLRQRYAGFVRAAYAIPALRASVSLASRAYRDTWDVRAVTTEAVVQAYLHPAVLVALRGRYHVQSGAIFFRTATDYEIKGPPGAYWTGDRELSPMGSILTGLKIAYLRRRDQRPQAFFEEVDLNMKFDLLYYQLKTDAPNADRPMALIWQGGVSARF